MANAKQGKNKAKLQVQIPNGCAISVTPRLPRVSSIIKLATGPQLISEIRV